MIKCPQCGYERKKTDEIISAEECPRCGIIYSKWKQAPVEESTVLEEKATVKTSGQIRPFDSESTGSGERKITRIITFIVLAAIVIIGGHYLLNTFLRAKPPQEKPKLNEVVQPLPPSGANENQLYSGAEINSGNAKQRHASEGYIPERESMSASDLFRKNYRSVIIVKTQKVMGSGFFVNYSGDIVTNKHVLTDLSGAEIRTVSGNTYKIKGIVAEDAGGDLVIASTGTPPSESIPVTLTSNLPEIGEKVIVIGSPLGLEQTLSDGIVSSIRRNQYGVNYIQVTAPVSSGNSGGPLLNMYGEVIGVATFQYRQGQNLNFCVAAGRVVALQNGTLQNSAMAAATQKELYCYADARGELHFVDWRTGVQVSRADGSLDREKFQRYALDIVGGNPMSIDPAREAQDALDQNKEKMFKLAFPDKSLDSSSLTSYEQQWWERRQRQFYNQAYNNAVSRKYAAVTKYNYMMKQFDYYSSRYSRLQ